MDLVGLAAPRQAIALADSEGWVMGTGIDQETFDQIDYARFRQRLQQCLVIRRSCWRDPASG